MILYMYILQNDYHNKVLTHPSPHIVTAICVCVVRTLKMDSLGGFPGGAVAMNLPANAGDMGSSPGLGRSRMPQSN